MIAQRRKQILKTSKGKALVLIAGAKAHMRPASARNWTKAKEREFLSVLGQTCNVTLAARQAGVSVSYAYKKRAANAGFHAAWLEAVAAAYQRLELVLLQRAFHGTLKRVRRRDGTDATMREYSNQLGLALLKMHRETAVEADSETPSEDVDEIRERLINKLQRLKARNDAQDQPDD